MDANQKDFKLFVWHDPLRLQHEAHQDIDLGYWDTTTKRLPQANSE